VLGFNGTSGLTSNFTALAGFQRIGVWGDAENAGTGYVGIGVMGTSDTGVGLFASVKKGNYPALVAEGGFGAVGTVENGSSGVEAIGGDAGCCSAGGASGAAGNGIVAVGGSGYLNDSGGASGVGGVFTGGVSNCSGNGCGADGIHVTRGRGPGGAVAGMAGFFDGDIFVTGGVSAARKNFKIDHPLDPATKYLVHASVESSEMMNIYTGNSVLDTNGAATVELPEWFEALNRDFRYQLTAVGRPGPGLYVAQKISGNHFTIAGGTPGGEVSWQVTGIRHDAYAKAHPLVVEEKKNTRESGYYIHPELYGAPLEKQIEWARHPELMKQLKAQREKHLAHLQARPTDH
jgi:hypothetical protein